MKSIVCLNKGGDGMFRILKLLTLILMSFLLVAPGLSFAGGECTYAPKNKSAENLAPIGAFEGYDAAKTNPMMDTSQRRLLRRLWLDLVGLHPSVAEVNAFLADTNPAKWDVQVEQLLASEAFTERWTTFFDDMLWNHLLVDGGFIRNNMHDHLRSAISQNLPIDEMVRQILTTEGRNELPKSANFFYFKEYLNARHRLDFLDDQMGNITETFLGIRTTCISCHDGAYHLEQVNSGLAK